MDEDDIRFDRTLCAEPCGRPHYHDCNGNVVDECTWEVPQEIVSARLAIGKRLTRERKHANLSRGQMALRLYTTNTHYAKMEETAYAFTWLLVKQLASALGIRPSNLAPEYCAVSFPNE